MGKSLITFYHLTNFIKFKCQLFPLSNSFTRCRRPLSMPFYHVIHKLTLSHLLADKLFRNILGGQDTHQCNDGNALVILCRWHFCEPSLCAGMCSLQRRWHGFLTCSNRPYTSHPLQVQIILCYEHWWTREKKIVALRAKPEQFHSEYQPELFFTEWPELMQRDPLATGNYI